MCFIKTSSYIKLLCFRIKLLPHVIIDSLAKFPHFHLYLSSFLVCSTFLLTPCQPFHQLVAINYSRRLLFLSVQFLAATLHVVPFIPTAVVYATAILPEVTAMEWMTLTRIQSAFPLLLVNMKGSSSSSWYPLAVAGNGSQLQPKNPTTKNNIIDILCNNMSCNMRNSLQLA